MTKDEIIKAAQTNGYVTGKLTDAQLLSDPAFFKAAYGTDSVVSVAASKTIRCVCGREHSITVVNERPVWTEKMAMVVDAMTAGQLPAAAIVTVESVQMVKKAAIDVALVDATLVSESLVANK